jgi:quercetin dioxygenase-like cupin family protein
MEEANNKFISLIPQQDLPIDAPVVAIDLPALLKQIKEESSWKDSKRNAITVFKTQGFRIVLIALHEGAEMARHIADGIISVQVLEGEIQFNTDLQSVQLSEGQMLALHERIPHSVLALKETIFLLTLSFTTILG